jgi:hypothetical protein
MPTNQDTTNIGLVQDDLMVKFGYIRAGDGRQKDARCQQLMGHAGCLREDLHRLITKDGHNFSNQIYGKRVWHSCDRLECPKCYLRCATEKAGNAEQRLEACGNRFGDLEHIIVSVPKSQYNLYFDELKAKALEAARARGVLGGFLIFHAQRYANWIEAKTKGVPFGWYYSPHFHILGYLDGGYGACRSCKKHNHRKECWNCKGFEGVTRRLNVTDGYIVKVKGARKTIFGTLYYQLNHATVVKGKVRSHVGTWFGVCSYSKLKLKKSDRKRRASVCPICGHDLVPIQYVGIGEPNGGHWWIDEFYNDFLDDRGVPLWVPRVRGNREHE